MTRLDSRFLKKFNTREYFNGNGSTTVFNLSGVPQENDTVEIYVNGVAQEEGVGKDYTLSVSAITFVTAPANAQRIEVRYWKNIGE